MRSNNTMSCNRFHYDMSLNLDGRLSSGRREALLAHIAECIACAELWDEMQSAQELALSLPDERISCDFGDALWDRIRSGEGTPEAVYLEPMPIWHKVRYLMTGAAAAATVLVGVHVWTSSSVDGEPTESGQDPVRIARGGDDEHRETRTTRGARESAPPYSAPFALHPIDPPSVAYASASMVVDGIHALQSQIRRIERSGEDVGVPSVREKLRGAVGRVRGAAQCIFWLQRDNLITMPGDVEVQLEMLDRVCGELAQAREKHDLLAAFASISRIDAQRMNQPFVLRCCDYPTDFPDRFRMHVERNPEVRTFLRFDFIREPMTLNGGASVLLLQDPTIRVQIRTTDGLEAGMVERHGKTLAPRGK